MTADVALYGHWTCPYVTRVRFALAHRGIDHELVDVPPSAVRPAGFVLPPEFVEHSPRLEVPLVRVGGDHLVDSIPILEWLEQRVDAPSLLPVGEVERALVRERMEWIDRNAFRAMIGVYYGLDDAAIARSSDELVDALDHLGRWTTDGGWLAGSRPTLADAVAIPIHVRMDGLRRLGFFGELSPHWLAHAERCRGLDAWQAVAWTSEQTEEFVGRFLARRRRHAERVS